MSYNVIRASEAGDTICHSDNSGRNQQHTSTSMAGRCCAALTWTCLRSARITHKLCKTITFDPARENTDKNTQKVDAGLGPIGLHIENGNTPICPDIVAFYSTKAAFEGSQTTICDGRRRV